MQLSKDVQLSNGCAAMQRMCKVSVIQPSMSRFGLAVRCLAGNQKDLGSPFFSKLWFMDTVFVTFAFTINERFKRLSALPILMQNHSSGDGVASIVSLFAPLYAKTVPPPAGYLFRDNSALKTGLTNQPKLTRTS